MPVQSVNMQTSHIPYAIPIYSNQMMLDQSVPGYYNQHVSPVSPGSTPKDEKSPQHGKSQSKVKENVKEVGSKVVSAYGAIWVFIYVFYIYSERDWNGCSKSNHSHDPTF